MSCNKNSYLISGILVVLLVVAFIGMRNGESFIGPLRPQRDIPYYTTTFQAFPGKYMQFGSQRSFECLQRNGEYSGFRNCMLYLQ